MQSSINAKITQFRKPKRFGPEKCPVYLRLSWIGETDISFAKKISTSITQRDFPANSREMFFNVEIRL